MRGLIVGLGVSGVAGKLRRSIVCSCRKLLLSFVREARERSTLARPRNLGSSQFSGRGTFRLGRVGSCGVPVDG
jgi:hypothetical protein